MDIASVILFLSIISGQIIKIPLMWGGVTVLDVAIFLLTCYGFFNLKLKLKKPNLIIKLSLIFLGICLISLLFTPLKLNSSEYMISFSYILRLFFYFLFGWVIYSGGLKQIKKNIVKILIYSGISLSILGIAQLVIFPDLNFLSTEGWDPHYYRIVSTFLDPNFLGAYLVLSLLLIYSFGRKYFSENLRGGVFILVFLCLALTFSRGAYLMFAVSFICLSILYKSFKLVSVTILLCIILLLFFYSYNNFIASPRNIDRTQSAEYRLNAWNQGINLFSKNPILGNGFNTYRFALKEYNLSTNQFFESHGASTNDSSLLYVASTTGVIGLLVFLSLIISIIVLGYKIFLKEKLVGAVLLAGVGGLLVNSLFANSLFYPFVLIWLIMYLNTAFD